MYDIVAGRIPKDFKKFGTEGTGYIGKHVVGEGDEAHLTNKVLIDFLRPHVILIAGKRGSGKSYSGGVLAEELAILPEEFSQNLSSIMIDTMGIYWSMKYPNEDQMILLDEWGLKPRGLEKKVRTYVPFKQKQEFEEAEIPVDFGVSITPYEFTQEDWTLAFNLPPNNPTTLGLQKTVNKLQDSGEKFDINDMITRIKDDHLLDTHVKSSLENMLTIADQWGVFGEEGIKIDDIVNPGTVNVFDISRLRATEAWSVKNLLVATICRKLYQHRVMARKLEELAKMGEIKLEKRYPMPWLIIDEAHQFVPSNTVTVSSGPILDIVKQGRQPGITFVPMTQMPDRSIRRSFPNVIWSSRID